jgi:hypothetical protein
MHSFLLPLLAALLFPRNIYITAFFIGYTAHMLADLNSPKKEWVWIKQRFGVALLWLSFFILLMLIFNVGFENVFNIFK